jgi:DNA-binding GntR family transcriptional regulator
MRDEWAALNEEFHNALASGCNNQWLLRVRKMLFTQCERYRRLSISINPHRDVEKEHKAILNAALKRNATRAIALMTSHILKTQAEIVNSTMIEAAPARLMKSISPRIPLNVPRGSKSRMVRTTQDS